MTPPVDAPRATRPAPFHHQTTGTRWLREVGRGLLADEPGLGKTRQLIEASSGRTLVVAPGLVLAGGTWDTEITRWADTPERFTSVPYTTLPARDGRKITTRVRDEYAGPWDTIILDESHYVKGRTTSWTQVLRGLARTTPRVFLATGTPVPNWGPEIFTTLQLLHGQDRPGQAYGAYWRWANQWFATEYNHFAHQTSKLTGRLHGCTPDCPPATCPHWAAFTAANLGGRVLRRTAADCLDLPPLTVTTIRTPMATATHRAYRDMHRDFWAEIEGIGFRGDWTVGGRNHILAMIAVSPWLLSPTGTPTGGKFDRLAADLSDYAHTGPILVLAHHTNVVDACAAVATAQGLTAAAVTGRTPTRQAGDAIRAFRDGRLDVLAGSLDMLGEGHTFTAGTTAIFVEKSWVPARNAQARRRLHRPGQTRHVHVLEYVTPGSVDDVKERTLAEKATAQDGLTTAMTRT